MNRRSRLLAIFLSTLLTSISCSGPSDTSSTESANQASSVGHHPIVLILLDGVRVDHLGAYGASSGATPNLDRFAQGAVRFEWAFAQAPDPASSMASLLTGLYPTTHGLVDPGEVLVGDAGTLAEALAGAGSKTAAFLTSGEVFADLGLDQGFEIFEPGPQALDGAVDWIGDIGNSDFLLLVEAGSVVASDVESDDSAASYTRQVAALDSSVGRVLEAIESAGLTDETTIAVVSLSGFELAEHGDVGERTLYAPVTHVPVLLRSPRISRTTAIDKIVEVVDMAPTLLELSGEEPGPDLQGRSLLPLIEGEGSPPYVAFGESGRNGGEYFAALGGYRLIRRGVDGPSELYNLATDPWEQMNLAGSEENRVAVLEDHLGAWQKMVSVASLDPERRTEELDDEALEQLKSLGYIQ